MWRVVIGATQLTQLGPEAQVRNIKRLLVHKHYSSISERNDIALLELDQPVQCSYYIQLACVPDASLRVSELTTCYISGWGSTTARSGGSTDVLQEAKVRLIDVNLCNSSWWYSGAIHTHNLCAGYPQGGIDTCQVGACYKSAPSSAGSPVATAQTYPGACFAWQVTLPPGRVPTAVGAHLPFPICRSLPSAPLVPEAWGTAQKAHPALLAARRFRSQLWNIRLPHIQDHCAEMKERALPYRPTTPSQTRFCRLQHLSRAFLCSEYSSGRCCEREGASHSVDSGHPTTPSSSLLRCRVTAVVLSCAKIIMLTTSGLLE
ncbi:uncharacterized protein J5F26_000260 isoform 1-T1 [Ciconia maguari]